MYIYMYIYIYIYIYINIICIERDGDVYRYKWTPLIMFPQPHNSYLCYIT